VGEGKGTGEGGGIERHRERRGVGPVRSPTTDTPENMQGESGCLRYGTIAKILGKAVYD
jgi:hypothetical protein